MPTCIVRKKSSSCHFCPGARSSDPIVQGYQGKLRNILPNSVAKLVWGSENIILAIETLIILFTLLWLQNPHVHKDQKSQAQIWKCGKTPVFFFFLVFYQEIGKGSIGTFHCSILMDLSTSFCHSENVIEKPTQAQDKLTQLYFCHIIFSKWLTVYIDQNLPGCRYFAAKMFASVF